MTVCAVQAFGRRCRAFLHEVECEFARELDEAVITSFRDDEDRLYLGADSCAACMSVKTDDNGSNMGDERTKLL